MMYTSPMCSSLSPHSPSPPFLLSRHFFSDGFGPDDGGGGDNDDAWEGGREGASAGRRRTTRPTAGRAADHRSEKVTPSARALGGVRVRQQARYSGEILSLYAEEYPLFCVIPFIILSLRIGFTP